MKILKQLKLLKKWLCFKINKNAITFKDNKGIIDFSDPSFPSTIIQVFIHNKYIGAFERVKIIEQSIVINHFALFHRHIRKGLGENVLRAFANEIKCELPNITNIEFLLTNYKPINNYTPLQMANSRQVLFSKLGAHSNQKILPSNQITVSANWQKQNWQ